MNNDLTSFVIYYSLFKKKIYEDNEIIKLLPKNAFGIFTSIKRNKKLNVFPVDIHGCIGYWDPNFYKLSQTNLYENMLRVSYDALWNDERRHSFEIPIEKDPYSHLELDFMLEPFYEIDKSSGLIPSLKNISFDNNIFGIIIQSRNKSNVRKATYLPGVFSSISFHDIIKSIKKKAKINNNNENYDIFAYKIKKITRTFIELLGTPCIDISIKRFLKFITSSNHYKEKEKYFFVYFYKNNKFSWNSDEDVRNISLLADILKYSILFPKVVNKKIINKIVKKIIHILENLNNYSSQSLSFLGNFIKLYINSKNKFSKNKFSKKLLNELKFGNPDPEFATPEIIIGLKKANISVNNNILNTYLKEISDFDSIFKLNWLIQLLYAYTINPSEEIINILVNKIITITNNIFTYETNYLAVAFESLCFLQNFKSTEEITTLLFQLFYELEKRKVYDNILYGFLNKSARIDITTHVLNGFVQLL
jgi:hypothetical protein